MRIDAHTTLAIVTAVCGSGAYNYYGIPMLLRDDGKREVADLEKHEEGDVTMNLTWDENSPHPVILFQGPRDWAIAAPAPIGRGTARIPGGQGDLMGECLGAIAWIPIYRARPVPR